MVPKVAGRGSSFKGAGLYYLHDKRREGERERLTSERVEFTRTENLPTDDPHKALAWMAYTAMHQNDLKRQSGQVRTGRKLTVPVYTYSLSWHPEEEPSREDMIAAAHETIKVLGLEGYETLMIAHNDEPHKHIHIIVNRVHPETGIATKLPNDHLDLSRWAEDYERRTGKIRCEQRVENNAKRKRGEFARDTRSLSKAEYLRAQARHRAVHQFGRTAPPPDPRKYLDNLHDKQRRDLHQEKEQQVSTLRAAIRERYRPQWRKLYTGQRKERAKLAKHSRLAQKRLQYWLNNKEIDRYGGSRKTRAGHLSRAFAYVTRTADAMAAIKAAQAKERAKLSAKHRETLRKRLRTLNERYKRDLAKLKKQQQADRDAARAVQRVLQKPSQPAPAKPAKAPLTKPFNEQASKAPAPPAQQHLTPKQRAFLDLLRATGQEITQRPQQARQQLSPQQQALFDQLQTTGRDITAPAEKSKEPSDPTLTPSQAAAMKAFLDLTSALTKPAAGKTAPQKSPLKARDKDKDTKRDRDRQRRDTAKDITSPAEKPRAPAPAPPLTETERTLKEFFDAVAAGTKPAPEKPVPVKPAAEKPAPEKTPARDKARSQAKERRETAKDITQPPAQEPAPLSDLITAFTEAAKPPEREQRGRANGGDKPPAQPAKQTEQQREKEDERARRRREIRETAADITSDTDTPASELDELADALQRRARQRQRRREREKKRGGGKDFGFDFDPDRGR